MPDEFIISKFLRRPEYPAEISTRGATMKVEVLFGVGGCENPWSQVNFSENVTRMRAWRKRNEKYICLLLGVKIYFHSGTRRLSWSADIFEDPQSFYRGFYQRDWFFSYWGFHHFEVAHRAYPWTIFWASISHFKKIAKRALAKMRISGKRRKWRSVKKQT